MNAPWYHSNLGGRYAAFLKRSFFCQLVRGTRLKGFRFFHHRSSDFCLARTKENEATSPSLFHRCSCHRACWQRRWKWEGFWSGLGGSSQRFFFFFFFSASSTTTEERGCWGNKQCWWNGKYRCVYDDRKKKKGWLLEEESGEEHYSMAWIRGIVFVLFLSTK